MKAEVSEQLLTCAREEDTEGPAILYRGPVPLLTPPYADVPPFLEPWPLPEPEPVPEV